jgi:RNA polymerase sigma factor (sigma-70 family)
MDDRQAQLVEQAVAGDMDALSTLLTEHGPGIANRLATQIRPVYRGLLDAEDVMQVTYLEAFLRIARFTPRDSGGFVAWLNRIATNNLRDAVRELERLKRPPAARRVTVGGSESGAAALLDQAGWTSTTPSRVATNDEMRTALIKALEQLPADYATVLRLYDLEERKVDDVAEHMQRSIGAVYMLRARAIDQLRVVFSGISDIR